MAYNFKEGLSIYGDISAKKLFVNTFGVYPNLFSQTFDTTQTLNFNTFNPETLKQYFPDAVFVTKASNDYENTEDESIIEDYIDIVDDEIRTSEIYSISIFCDKRIFLVDSRKIEALYTGNCNIKQDIQNLLNCFGEFTVDLGKATEVGLVCISNGEYWVSRDKDSRINYTDVNLTENYNDDFIDIDKKIVEFLNPDNRKSGVILLSSIPGLGKTFYLKNLITKHPNNYIYITSGMAAHLADPEFTSFLMGNKNSVFILEDCEEVIMDRSDSNFAGALSSLLNMADGIMSDIFNGKFICTFNTDLSNIDPALLRPGRCIVNYKFEPLCIEKTKNLLNKRGITLDEYRPMTLAEIYNYDSLKKIDEPKKIGF